MEPTNTERVGGLLIRVLIGADADDLDHFRCVELMRHTPAPLLMPIPVLTVAGYLLSVRRADRDKVVMAGAQ
jgi:hypothetical protein